MAKVVVIGAGLAGLATALRLADLRHDVTVLERSSTVGGQIDRVELDGGVVDLGPAAFTLPAPVRELFRSTGRPLERELDLVPADPAMRVLFGDGSVVELPNATSAGARRAFDDALGAGSGAEWDSVVRHGDALWRTLRPRVMGYAARAGTRVAALDEYTAHLHDDRLRSLLGWHATTVGEYPAGAPESVTVLPYLEQAFGTWTVRGGPGRLVDALRDRAEQRGARVRTDTAVQAIDVGSGRRATAVVLADGERLGADLMVAAVQPAAVRELVPVPLLRDPRRSLTDLATGLRRDPGRPSGRSCLCVVLRAPAGPRAQDGARVVLPPAGDRPAMTVHRAGDAAGPEVIWVINADCAPHGTGRAALDWTAPGVADRHTAALIRHAVAAGALGPAAAEIAPLLVRTPYDWAHRVGAPGGRVHGERSGDPPAYVSRPGPSTRVDGLLLAGAGAHPGPGVPMGVISSGLVADRVGRA
ncbi:phytoene dehydrogenase-like protein [Haloactinopolyspora alba]|uniref:Phytoene dehydrogenase-like protein n=1 Tax=Haloactinopolyspora alba TaxID=648780 RepID=A0A2P8E2F5_9ACTN|nr:FAD-dependent oxidoreductase [Haloactinopolyspora alba]PSL03654.1 phytoene dehydrogenase-like protein [Haloactinopolyspora alba]